MIAAFLESFWLRNVQLGVDIGVKICGIYVNMSKVSALRPVIYGCPQAGA